MTADWMTEAEALSGELSALREAFHRMPELGNHEWKTAERIEAYLHACGIPTERPFGTAVIGRLTGALPGKTAALRADMDALPLTEATGAPFASETPGVMHACGHDIHMTAALGAAKLLSARRESLQGSVVFLFQPDEEGDGGAQRMIEAGCLDGVDAVFGAHVSPALPAGCVGVRYGKFYAASDVFHITVRGKSAHGAERERGIDALEAAARLVPALLALPETFPGERSVVSVGQLHAGTAVNIVAERAELSGVLRTLGQDSRAAMGERLTETARRVAAQTGASAEVTLHGSYPGVVNHDDMTRLAQEAAEALLGADKVSVIPEPTMTTEDFGYFLLERPGTFYHLGAGCPLPLHNAAFLPEASTAVTGAAMHAAVIERFLSTNP